MDTVSLEMDGVSLERRLLLRLLLMAPLLSCIRGNRRRGEPDQSERNFRAGA